MSDLYRLPEPIKKNRIVKITNILVSAVTKDLTISWLYRIHTSNAIATLLLFIKKYLRTRLDATQKDYLENEWRNTYTTKINKLMFCTSRYSVGSSQSAPLLMP